MIGATRIVEYRFHFQEVAVPEVFDQNHPAQPSILAPVDVARPENEGVDDPNVILPPVLRDIRLSEEAAAAMKQLLEDAKQPTHSGREMPTADASVLLKNHCE
jgi:hypothetical protein